VIGIVTKVGTCDLSSGDELVKKLSIPHRGNEIIVTAPLSGLFVPAFSVFLNMYHYQIHCVLFTRMKTPR